MNFYFNTVTEETGFQGDLALLGWTEGQPLPENWVSVAYGEQPTVEDNQYFVLTSPEVIDGVWVANFTVHTLTEEQLAKRQEFLLNTEVTP